MNKQENRKHFKIYIFYRVYVVLIILFDLIFAFFWLRDIYTNQFSRSVSIASIILIACSLLAFLFISSLVYFPFEYSIFGSLERMKFPEEKPLLVVKGSWGGIGSFRATIPFFSWYVFPSGLGISILNQKMYIPLNQIISVDKLGYFIGRGNLYEIKHKSPEINNEIYLPDKKVFEVLRKLHQSGNINNS